MPSKELRPYKEISKELAIEDTAAVLDMTCAILKNLGGRPAVYPNTEAGINSFIENSQGYFNYLQSANSKLDEKQRIIPDIESYCLWLGITRETLRNYSNRGGDWAAEVTLFKNAIATVKKELMLKGRIPPMVGVFDLVNNHGYFNTNSFVLETKNDKVDESADNLEERIRAAGLVWDSEKGEFIPQ